MVVKPDKTLELISDVVEKHVEKLMMKPNETLDTL